MANKDQRGSLADYSVLEPICMRIFRAALLCRIGIDIRSARSPGEFSKMPYRVRAWGSSSNPAVCSCAETPKHQTKTIFPPKVSELQPNRSAQNVGDRVACSPHYLRRRSISGDKNLIRRNVSICPSSNSKR